MEPIKASALAERLAHDGDWLVRHPNVVEVIAAVDLDGEIPALDIESSLRAREQYGLALAFLDRIRRAFPNGDLALYRSALNAAGLRDYGQAIAYAAAAVARGPDRLDYRSCLIRALALGGNYSQARSAICATAAFTRDESEYVNQLVQFTDFCEAHSVEMSRRALEQMKVNGSYCEPQGVKDLILGAVRARRPFSMVRLGDGEGAWLRLNAYDEGRFATLYRHNRISFLQDWFGSDHLIDDVGFRAFTFDLQTTFLNHDLIGVPPVARLDQEQGFMSMRGLPSSGNAFRLISDGGATGRPSRFCSNSINLDLAYHTSFYQELFKNIEQVGIITSQIALHSLFESAGIKVVGNYIVPGDSRNFHHNDQGVPLCQYPDYVQTINARLRETVTYGQVYLVAAGFVGKEYLNTIRQRGGIAIDLGSLADQWARGGLPL